MQFQPEVGRDDDIACPLPLSRPGEPCIQIGGEENRAGKLLAQRLQEQELVVYVASQYADGTEFLTIACFLLFQRGGQPEDVIELAAAFRPLAGVLFAAL